MKGHRHLGAWVRLGAVLLLLAGCRESQGHSIPRGGQAVSVTDVSGPQSLTVQGELALQKYLGQARLPDLEWPNFSDCQNEVKEFYAAFRYHLPWIRDGKPTVEALQIIQSLESAQYKGLRPEDYDGSRWDARLAQMEKASESDLVRFDLALTVSTMRYVSDLHVGRVNPRLFHFDLVIDHTNFHLSEFLRQKLVSSDHVDSAVASVEPPFPVYHRTEAVLKRYLQLSRQGEGQPIPVPSRPIKPGSSYSAAPELAKRLAFLGDFPADLAYDEGTYQGPLVDSVKHFQVRHGLEANGVIDRTTVKELNTPLSYRITQLELTMERIRWLPHEFRRPPIVVNIPEFRLYADDEQFRWVLSMKVVVGRAYRHHTPVFASEIRSVIFRPYWDVPRSILEAEILPHLKKNPMYLAENSYEAVARNGTVASEGAVNQEILDQLQAGVLRVRQTPGPKNALGLVKFDIPSPYDVYMHGTPATELFSRSRRDFSHGCIRVEDPVALAEWVLRGIAGWDEQRIRAAMNGEETLRVPLEKPVPVLVLYGTAIVMEDGEVRFFEDIYGQDAALKRVLDQGYPYAVAQASEGQ